MIILPEMAVTDFYSHSETDEDVMRESWNTTRPVGGFSSKKENLQEVLKAKNLTKNYANMTPRNIKVISSAMTGANRWNVSEILWLSLTYPLDKELTER